jgi:hypothetical protein
MIGKLTKQDLAGTDPGYREALKCPMHGEEVMVIGPRLLPPRYTVTCVCESSMEGWKRIAEADTMQEIWKQVHA